MAQRISRAKRTVEPGAGVDRPGDVRTVMRVLYLVFNEGYSGDVDLAAEAIRLDPPAGGVGGRSRGPRAARPDAAAPRPPPQPHPAGREHRAARRPGPQPVGHRRSSPRDRHPAGRAGRATGSASTRRRRRSPPCTPTRRAWRRPTGSRSWSGTTSCCASPTPRSSGSTGRSRSARPTARRAGLAALAEVDEHVPRRDGGRRLPPREERRPRGFQAAAPWYGRSCPANSYASPRSADHQTRQAAPRSQGLRRAQLLDELGDLLEHEARAADQDRGDAGLRASDARSSSHLGLRARSGRRLPPWTVGTCEARLVLAAGQVGLLDLLAGLLVAEAGEDVLVEVPGPWRPCPRRRGRASGAAGRRRPRRRRRRRWWGTTQATSNSSGGLSAERLAEALRRAPRGRSCRPSARRTSAASRRRSRRRAPRSSGPPRRGRSGCADAAGRTMDFSGLPRPVPPDEGHLVVLAHVLDGLLAGDDLADDVDVLPRAGQRLREVVGRVPALDDLRAA